MTSFTHYRTTPYTPSGGSASTIASMSYDAGMRHTSAALGNGLTPTYAYRGTTGTAGDNMLESITVASRAGLTLDYSYDANKNMTAEDTGGVMDDYGVDLVQDAKDRMTSWTRDTTNTALDSQSWNLSFESDWDDTTLTDASTPVTQARTHNAAHELLTIDPDNTGTNPFSQTHDAKGNLTADGDGLAHTFDFDNMLKQVVVAGASPRGIEGTHTYAYDALGRRVSKSVDTDADNTPDQTTVFVCAGQQVIAEYEGGAADTSPERKYIFCATGYIDEPIAMIDATSGGGSGEDTYYYHRNRQFSIIGLTDDTGTVIERYAYTAYGEVTVLDANAAADADGISDVLNSYTYTGRRLDDETGLLYFRARYHDPVLGRFLERDPLGYPDGLNTYAAYYVIRGLVDPHGLSKAPVKLPSELGNDKPQEWEKQKPIKRSEDCEEIEDIGTILFIHDVESKRVDFAERSGADQWQKVHTVSDLINALRKLVADCKCVSGIMTSSHGGWAGDGGFRLGDDTDGDGKIEQGEAQDFVSTPAEAKRFGEIIKEAFCDESYIAIEACSSSGDDDKFIKELHKSTGVTVIGSIGSANVGGSRWSGGWWTADDGRSQIEDGNITTDETTDGTGIWEPF